MTDIEDLVQKASETASFSPAEVKVSAKTMKALGFEQPDIDKAAKPEGFLANAGKTRFFIID